MDDCNILNGIQKKNWFPVRPSLTLAFFCGIIYNYTITTSNREVYQMNYDNLFDIEHIEHIRRMRSLYFQTGSTDGITDVRPEILTCWKLSRQFNQRPESSRTKASVSPEILVQYRTQSKNLMDIAEPYMHLLLSFLKQNSFWVTLTDLHGVVLRIIGSPEMVEFAHSTGLFEGSYRGPDAPYCGLFFACQHFDKPFQIVSTEHPASIDDVLAGSAAPIHDAENGRYLGSIGISGYWRASHDHTLGLTIMTAEAISRHMALQKINLDVSGLNHKLNSALENVDGGVIYFVRNGSIHTVNTHAIEFLCSRKYTKTEFIENSIYSYLNPPVQLENMDEVDEVIRTNGAFSCDLTPRQKYSQLRCTIRRASPNSEEYAMQLQKRTSLNKMAVEIAFPKAQFTFKDIIGTSEALSAAKNSAEIAAMHSPSVLITGESGTGKELFAQAIHNSSSRADGPFIAINCGAIPKSLIESELFGYEDGAFTGARKNGNPGKFELANHGTIFLDEIGDMPYETQIALLRVLQSKEVVRIGGKTPIKVDVKVIAATNQNLEQKIAEHSFRQDLYYRLNVLSIQLPPLRNREDDILLLSQYFLKKYGQTFDKRVDTLSDSALSALKTYSWPGNVREFENVIERAVIVCHGTRIEETDLPDKIRSNPNAASRTQTAALTSSLTALSTVSFQSSELERLRELLNAHDGNVSEVARQLGVSRPTIYRRMKKVGLTPSKRQYN